MGIFNISSHAIKRIEAKRKRKGYGELTPRKKNIYPNFYVYATSLTLAKTLICPLERIRTIRQTNHMINVKPEFKNLPNSMAVITSKLFMS